MPHIIVEHSEAMSSVDMPKLIADLHESLAAQDTVNIHAIKSRAIAVQCEVIGDHSDPYKMLHITLKLLPGRDNALKKAMSQALFDTAHKHIGNEAISLSVEVMELHAESYTK